MQLLSVNALAEILGIERRTVLRKLANLAPDQEVPTGRGVDRRWAMPRVIAHLYGAAGGGGDEDLDLEAERARLAKEQADKTALENSTRRGELLEVKAVERAWASIMVAIRQRLLALPSELAPELATITNANRIRDRLATEVTHILREATAHRVEAASLDGPDAGDEGPGDPAPAAPANGQRVGRRKSAAQPGKQRKGGPVAH